MKQSGRIPPRWLRWTLVVIAVVIPCVMFGVTTATADGSLGPHEARYEVTTNGEVEADLGPLGSIQIDSPLPFGLGVTATVEEIPADLTAISEAQTLQALNGDLSNYLQFFSSPQQTIHLVSTELLVDAAKRTILAIIVVVLVGGGLYLLLGPTRRRELSARAAPRTWSIAVGMVLVLGVATTLTASGRMTGSEKFEQSPVFEGTALQGARITGRLAGVINTYGEQLVSLYHDSQKFYAKANRNLTKAWEQRTAQQDAQAKAARGLGGFAGTSPASSGPPTQTPTSNDEDLVTLLVVSDLHCNTGMAPLIGTSIKRSGADAVLNAGDTTLNGTAVESICVNAFAADIPDGIPFVVADGNHDSPTTSSQERKANQKVLRGKVITVKEMRILGDSDPYATRLNEGTYVAGESPQEESSRLARTACEQEDRVDILLIHRPTVGLDSMASGCVSVQISGHMHVRQNPRQVGRGVRYISGSTAGAVKDQLTVGPLKGTAEMTVLRFDPLTRLIVDWQLIQVRPDGSASVGERQAFPRAVGDAGDVTAPESGY